MTRANRNVQHLAPARERKGWSRSITSRRCNYHHERAAIAQFHGTPLCVRCARRILRHEPDGGLG